jgi:hypothetical protein
MHYAKLHDRSTSATRQIGLASPLFDYLILRPERPIADFYRQLSFVMEAVGLALAILPLVIEALKAYSHVCNKARVFRQYSREVTNIQVLFDGQKAIFVNECRLIFHFVLGDEIATKEMIEDPSHMFWNDPELDGKFQKSLGQNSQLFKAVLEEIRRTLEEVMRDMLVFDVVEKRPKVLIHVLQNKMHC